MQTTTLADSDRGGCYSALPLPLYLSFTLSRQAHLGTPSHSQQDRQQHIHLDHGFQLALLANDNSSSDNNSDNNNKDNNNSDNSNSGNNNINNSNGTYNNLALCDIPTTNCDGDLTNNINDSIVLEMTLTLDHHIEHAKVYAAMVRAVHLFEIDHECDRLSMSKAVDGCDLIRQGVSILLDTDSMGNQDLCTFGILLSSNPLDLLVPSEAINQSASDGFGRSMLIRFLLDISSTDLVYATAPIATNKDHHPTRSSIQGQGLRQMMHAHSAIMRQWPAFDRLLRHFPRPHDYPKTHKLIDIDPYAMRLVINFLYTGQIEGPGYMGLVDWRHIFQLAHRLQIPRLIDLSLTELCKDMKIGTVLSTLFKWAYQHADYEDRLLDFLAEHLNDTLQPTLKESLQPFCEHPEFPRIQRKLETPAHPDPEWKHEWHASGQCEKAVSVYLSRPRDLDSLYLSRVQITPSCLVRLADHFWQLRKLEVEFCHSIRIPSQPWRVDLGCYQYDASGRPQFFAVVSSLAAMNTLKMEAPVVSEAEPAMAPLEEELSDVYPRCCILNDEMTLTLLSFRNLRSGLDTVEF
ncbi:hypothetical protein BGW39_010228 [Mortierella sp. 14UC]|nr:hypothetical protein BGW39_010228 [Mortierella sp. 14UC]